MGCSMAGVWVSICQRLWIDLDTNGEEEEEDEEM